MSLSHLSFALGLSALALIGINSRAQILQFAGIVLAALSQMLWFILLHECGHRSFFPRQWVNDVLGHLAGVIAILPYLMWRDIHAAHHLWAGWKDLDPTTRSVAATAPAAWKARAVNLFWKLRLPLFGLIYRLANFWNPGHCRQGKIFGSVSLVFTILPWLFLLIYLPQMCLPLLLAHILFLIFFELIMLSQHTHIPQSRAQGRKVMPFRPAEQVPVTRSLDFPRFFARWFLVHFNEHESHHEFPSVPGYFLDRVQGSGSRRVNWILWWWHSHNVPGEILLFEDEGRTGIRL